MPNEVAISADVLDERQDLVTRAEAINIDSPESYATAGAFLQANKGLQKKIKDFFSPHKALAKAAHDSLCQSEKAELSKLIESEAVIKQKIGQYDDEMRAKQESLRVEMQAEAQKQADDAALEAAMAAEAEGNKNEAEAIISSHVVVSPVVPNLTPKLEGVSTRRVYSAEVIDLKLLVAAVKENRVPLLCLEGNMPFLHSQARNFKEALNYPGVRVVIKTVVSGRAK